MVLGKVAAAAAVLTEEMLTQLVCGSALGRLSFELLGARLADELGEVYVQRVKTGAQVRLEFSGQGRLSSWLLPPLCLTVCNT